ASASRQQVTAEADQDVVAAGRAPRGARDTVDVADTAEAGGFAPRQVDQDVAGVARVIQRVRAAAGVQRQGHAHRRGLHVEGLVAGPGQEPGVESRILWSQQENPCWDQTADAEAEGNVVAQGNGPRRRGRVARIVNDDVNADVVPCIDIHLALDI